MDEVAKEERPQKKTHSRRDDRRHYHNQKNNNSYYHRRPYTVADAIADPKFKNAEQASDQPRSTNVAPTGGHHHHKGWHGHRRHGRHPNAPPPLPREEYNALGALPSWDDAGEEDDFDYMAYQDAMFAQHGHVPNMQRDQQVPVFLPHPIFFPPIQPEPVQYNQQMYVPHMVMPPMYAAGPTCHPAFVAPAQVQRTDESLKEYIRYQVEYYFSKSNLSSDHFMRTHMDKDGYISLSLIAGFRRVASLTTDVDLISSALVRSEVLELDEGGGRVRPREDPQHWPMLLN